MLTKNLSVFNKTNQIFSAYSITVRSIRHPIPAKAELIQGKSQVGKSNTLSPLRTEIEKGKSYAWCACGLSTRQPFCNGAHNKLNAEFKEGETPFAPLRFICEESRTVYFCNCKASSNRPFCDGTHEQLQKKKDAEKKFDTQ